MERDFFSTANLPGLTTLESHAVNVHDTDWGVFRSASLYPTDLHHLLINDDVLSVLPPPSSGTRQLRSLTQYVYTNISVPNDIRFETPLVALCLMPLNVHRGEVFLEQALKAGLIDRKTVVFFPGVSEGDAKTNVERKEWFRSHNIRVEWKDGDLERNWAGATYDEKYRSFTRWVDRIVEKRIAAARDE